MWMLWKYSRRTNYMHLQGCLRSGKCKKWLPKYTTKWTIQCHGALFVVRSGLPRCSPLNKNWWSVGVRANGKGRPANVSGSALCRALYCYCPQSGYNHNEWCTFFYLPPTTAAIFFTAQHQQLREAHFRSLRHLGISPYEYAGIE